MKTLEQLEKEMAEAKAAFNKRIAAENTRRHASLLNLLTKHCGVRDNEFWQGRTHVNVSLETPNVGTLVRVQTMDYRDYSVSITLDACEATRKELESATAKVYDLVDKLIEFNDNPQVELSFTLV